MGVGADAAAGDVEVLDLAETGAPSNAGAVQVGDQRPGRCARRPSRIRSEEPMRVALEVPWR